MFSFFGSNMTPIKISTHVKGGGIQLKRHKKDSGDNPCKCPHKNEQRIQNNHPCKMLHCPHNFPNPNFHRVFERCYFTVIILSL